MIMRNESVDVRPAGSEPVVQDGHWRVFNHHVYEYRKGLRGLVVQTLPRKYGRRVMARLEDLDLAYLIYPAGKTHINVFLGDSECLEIVRLIGKFDLSRYTPQEDFMLGIMLGYDRRQQCLRYLAQVERSYRERTESVEDASDLWVGAVVGREEKS